MTAAITSVSNPLVTEVEALARTKVRKERGETLLEGATLVDEALAAGWRPRLLLTLDADRWAGSADRVVEVGPAVLRKVSTTVTARDPVAVVAIPSAGPSGHLRLLAWGIGDPGNAGTLVRSSAAFGATVAFGGLGGVDPWAPKVLRSSAGTHARTVVAIVDTPEEGWAGTLPIALVVEGGIPPADVPPGPFTLVVGSEAAGLPPEIVAACEVACTIPMPGGAESLNAGVAGSIALHALTTRIG